jgi:sulfur-oxidizing protein SoxY
MSDDRSARYPDGSDSGSERTPHDGTGRGDAGVGRRGFLRAGVLVAAGLALGRPLLGESVPDVVRMVGASGPDDEMIEAVRQVLKAKFGDRPIQAGHVQLDIPTDAPDGRAVPTILDIDLPITANSYVATYHLLVDHNPDIYLAAYHLTAGSGEGPIETRIKMRRTSYVRAIAEMNTGELWSAATKVFVGLNGCG